MLSLSERKLRLLHEIQDIEAATDDDGDLARYSPFEPSDSEVDSTFTFLTQKHPFIDTSSGSSSYCTSGEESEGTEHGHSEGLDEEGEGGHSHAPEAGAATEVAFDVRTRSSLKGAKAGAGGGAGHRHHRHHRVVSLVTPDRERADEVNRAHPGGGGTCMVVGGPKLLLGGMTNLNMHAPAGG